MYPEYETHTTVHGLFTAIFKNDWWILLGMHVFRLLPALSLIIYSLLSRLGAVSWPCLLKITKNRRLMRKRAVCRYWSDLISQPHLSTTSINHIPQHHRHAVHCGCAESPFMPVLRSAFYVARQKRCVPSSIEWKGPFMHKCACIFVAGRTSVPEYRRQF